MDKKLIKNAKRGDVQAFEEIVTLYEKKIYNLAYRSSGNEHDAYDIMQEVFIRIYRSIAAFKEESSLSTWIYRITSNVCIDFSRKIKNTTSLDVEDDEGRQFVRSIEDNENKPEDVYEQKELREQINLAISKLSDEHKQVVVLRDIVGLTYHEIAETLSIEEGTVKSRLSRGRKSLRDIILLNGNFFKSFSSNSTEGRA